MSVCFAYRQNFLETKLKRFNSIKKNDDFRKVYKKGRSKSDGLLVMYVLNKDDTNNEEKISRIGISISKKVGNSVVRHRLTRLVRECFRLNKEDFKYDADIVVIVRKGAAESDFHEIEKSFLGLCKRQGLL